jgi:hypothetical protein
MLSRKDSPQKALADRVETKARAECAGEKRLLEAELAGERTKRAASQQAELDLRKEKNAVDPGITRK